ncbi:MAG: aminotransferase class III-fold pyridoxal phosphate-dependent enzyme [Polyangiales bacterium]
MVPPPGYLQGVRRRATATAADDHRRGLAGFGRTGSWFAFQHVDVVPDLITFAKGVNSGYVPSAA